MLRSVTEPFTYPGVKFFVFLACGILVGDWFFGKADLPIIFLVVGGLLVGGLGFLPALKRTPYGRLMFMGFASLCLGIGLQLLALESTDGSAIRSTAVSEKRTMEAVVASEPELLPDGYSCTVQLLSIAADSVRAETRSCAALIVSQYAESNAVMHIPTQGDTLDIHGWLNLPRTASVPGGFDYRTWLNRQGITVSIHAIGSDAVEIRPNSGFSLWAVIHRIRMGVYNAIEAYASERKGVLIALVLGDRGLLGSELPEAFRKTGIIHILAVSGLHTGIILLMFYVLLLRFPLRWRIPLVITGLIGYAMMTGLAPPVVRAAIIAIVFLAGRALQRTSPPVNAIAVAGAAILLFDPQALFTLSFQLSFLAAFSIALFYRPIEEALRKAIHSDRVPGLQYVRGLVAVTLAAQIGTIPVVLTTFGSLSVISILSNLVAIPLVFLTVVTAFAGLALHTLLPAAGGWLLVFSGMAADVLVSLNSILARIPFAEIHPGAPPWWVWLLYGALVLYVVFGQARLRTRLFIAVVALCAAIAGYYGTVEVFENEPLLEITFLDVGQGDATLIRTPDGGTVLIDAGPNYRNSDAGGRVILPYLHKRGIDRLDAVILTHADTDHIGGAETVLAGIDVDTVYYSGIANTKSATRDLDSVLAEREIPIREVFAGDRIPVSSEVRFYVLAPFRKAFPEESDNDASIVILAVYGQTRALFTGDADIPTEHALVSHYPSLLDVDVLKVGHHGSNGSTGAGFLSITSPQYAVISCGRNNRYKHPAPRVLKDLQASGARIFRTDVNGTVIISSDGKRFERMQWNN